MVSGFFELRERLRVIKKIVKKNKKSVLQSSRSTPCFAAIRASVKWLYVAEPRVGWVRSLPPRSGLSNTTPTTISLASFFFSLHALYGASIARLKLLDGAGSGGGGETMDAGFSPV